MEHYGFKLARDLLCYTGKRSNLAMKHIALTSIILFTALTTGAIAAKADVAPGMVQLASNSGSSSSCQGASFLVGAGNALDNIADGSSPKTYSAVASRYLDMQAISLAALGRYRKQLPPAKRAAYIALTKDFIGRFMAEHSAKFQTAGLTVHSCHGQSTAIVLKGKLASGRKFAAKLRRHGSKYRIIDIQLESFWLVQQLREAFVGTISRDGMDGLFRYLKS